MSLFFLLHILVGKMLTGNFEVHFFSLWDSADARWFLLQILFWEDHWHVCTRSYQIFLSKLSFCIRKISIYWKWTFQWKLIRADRSHSSSLGTQERCGRPRCMICIKWTRETEALRYPGSSERIRAVLKSLTWSILNPWHSMKHLLGKRESTSTQKFSGWGKCLGH